MLESLERLEMLPGKQFKRRVKDVEDILKRCLKGVEERLERLEVRVRGYRVTLHAPLPLNGVGGYTYKSLCQLGEV